MVCAVTGTRSRKKVWGASLILGANRAGISSLLSKPAVPTKSTHLPLPVLLLGLRGIFFYTDFFYTGLFQMLLYLIGRTGRLCWGRAAGSRAELATSRLGTAVLSCCNLPE